MNSKATLQYFVFQYQSGRNCHQLLIGGQVVAGSSELPDENPIGMIDVYYEDYSEYSHSDLLLAIERATASAKDILFLKMYYPRAKERKPIGRVTLFPMNAWRSKEMAVFEYLRPIIENAIKQERA